MFGNWEFLVWGSGARILKWRKLRENEKINCYIFILNYHLAFVFVFHTSRLTYSRDNSWTYSYTQSLLRFPCNKRLRLFIYSAHRDMLIYPKLNLSISPISDRLKFRKKSRIFANVIIISKFHTTLVNALGATLELD